MSCPLFSVIIPVHNAEKTIETTVLSLQSQKLQDWEALIVNDASTDRSVEILSKMAVQDSRLHLVNNLDRKQPLGAAATRNKGLENAKGRYIAFLDADDLWLPEKLTRQHEAFESGADIVFSSYRRVDAAGYNKGIVRARPHVVWQDALAGNPIGCSTGAYRRASFHQARMPLDAWPEDYGFWLGLLRGGTVAVGLPDILAEYRLSAGSVSSNKLASAYGVWRLLGKENISFARRAHGFSNYITSNARRRLHVFYRDNNT